ncbi:restriction endonuclease [Cohnella panacarvi]|uniref:nSTAND3 domain-containing NTPase n=1 Tax=Cohnella panacarvi TaxID=400776 RepID=UPI00047AB687|nr:restriction endonuclease [Cohnella panacarvi]
MFNYSNLNDVEFEALCKDVMEKKLSKSLRLFSKGRDGGVDLTDDTYKHNIIVQVKHYIGSSFSNLRSSLKKEIEKVQRLNPKQYYICCGMQLTEGNINEIYEMFSGFMESDRNIITLKEVDEFLQQQENNDVVRRHYKLWLYASNILNEIYNQDIFIDCESLLSDIDEESKFFVQTNVYGQCVEHLDKHGLLMITGGPGVGKTITSKMLVLFYASQGYRVRYSTNGDITDIKRSLSSDRECKEIVLLDDCLGQHYFNMKQTQENELLSLIKYIKLTTNKKLILNSRITIFNEAKERSIDFNKFFQERRIRNYIINMNLITLLEKSRIFYNHLIFKAIPPEYYSNVRENKNYLKIVQHANYTPRIIEHVTLATNYHQVLPQKYFQYIINNLSNPTDIWKNEFERRLQNVDRAFLSILYSLTDTNVDYGVMRECFNMRLLKMKDIDHTLNNFDLVISRLNQSIISIFDNKGTRQIGVINPSVNDYLKNVFAKNVVELNEVRGSICYFIQIERCYAKNDLPGVYLKYLESEKINNIVFRNEFEKNYFIAAHICENTVKRITYKGNIFNYLEKGYCYGYPDKDWKTHIEILECLLDDELYHFYSISDFFEDEDNIYKLLKDLDLDDLILTINLLNDSFMKRNANTERFKLLCQDLMDEAISDYARNIDAANYCENYDMGKIIQESTRTYYTNDEEDGHIDLDVIVSKLEVKIVEDVEQEIYEKIDMLNVDIKSIIKIPKTFELDSSEIEKVIDSFFRDDDYEDRRDYDRSDSSNISEIDAIFER